MPGLGDPERWADILDEFAPRPTPPRRVHVPNVLGLPISRASLMLHRAGLRVVTRMATAHPPPGPGVVVEQTPAAGTKARRHDSVELVLDFRAPPAE